MQEEEKKGGDSEEKYDGDEFNDDSDDEECRKISTVSGRYTIFVQIIKAKHLIFEHDDQLPVIEVNIIDQKQYTPIQNRKYFNSESDDTIIFNELLRFNFNNLSAKQFNSSKCSIKLYNAACNNGKVIGSFEIPLTQIYYKKHHELYRKWIILINKTNVFTSQINAVKGHIQATIVIIGPNDNRYIHPESEEFETESSLLNVMMPPQVETNPHLLKIYIHQLDKLMIMDKLTKSSDPYVLIKFAGTKNKTTTFKKKLDILIHEMVTIPVMEPILGNKIKIYVKDHDVAGKDDIIGTYIYEYNKIKKQLPDMYIKPHWMHMYGAPSGKQKKGIANKMNTNIIEGTTYRGSMLLSLSVNNKPNDDELKPITTKCNWDKKLSPKITQWVLQVDVYQGVEVGDGKGKFQIKMMIRDLKIKTEFTNCIKGSCEWYEILKLPDSDNNQDTIDLRMPKDIKQCPDVIFYLIEKKTGFDTSDNCISYLRFSWNKLINLGFNTPPKWYTFKSSSVLHKMGEYDFPGTILLGIRAGLKDDKPHHVSLLARPFLNINSKQEQQQQKEESKQEQQPLMITNRLNNNNKEESIGIFHKVGKGVLKHYLIEITAEKQAEQNAERQLSIAAMKMCETIPCIKSQTRNIKIDINGLENNTNSKDEMRPRYDGIIDLELINLIANNNIPITNQHKIFINELLEEHLQWNKLNKELSVDNASKQLLMAICKYCSCNFWKCSNCFMNNHPYFSMQWINEITVCTVCGMEYWESFRDTLVRLYNENNTRQHTTEQTSDTNNTNSTENRETIKWDSSDHLLIDQWNKTLVHSSIDCNNDYEKCMSINKCMILLKFYTKWRNYQQEIRKNKLKRYVEQLTTNELYTVLKNVIENDEKVVNTLSRIPTIWKKNENDSGLEKLRQLLDIKNINGSEFNQLPRKEWSKLCVKHWNNKKINSAAAKIHDAVLSFNIMSFKWKAKTKPANKKAEFNPYARTFSTLLKKVLDIKYSDVYNDYVHLMNQHFNVKHDVELISDTFEYIEKAMGGLCKYFNNERKHDEEEILPQCLSMSRNNRDRNLSSKTSIYFNRALYFVDNMSDKLQNDEANEINIQQLFDKLHCTLLHKSMSDDFHKNAARKRNRLKNNPEIANYDSDDDFLDEYRSIIEEQINGKTNNKIQNSKFTTEIEESLNDDEKNAEKNDVKQKKVISFSFGTEMNHDFLQPHYKCFKEEVMYHPKYGIQPDLWIQTLAKAKSCLNTYLCRKRLICKRTLVESGVYRNDTIGVNHILSMQFYCNFTHLQTDFRTTYRLLNVDNNSEHKLQERHSYFYFWGYYLYQALECFGTVMDSSVTVMHGLNIEMVFSRIEAAFNAPTSTTTALNVAHTFADVNGIILALKCLKNNTQTKYMDVAFISDFPSEREYLFYGNDVYFQITAVITTNNCKTYTTKTFGLDVFDSLINNRNIEWNKINPKRIKELTNLIKME
eukprot:154179_1